ncbi:unnamed protein product, partial [Closterium sp. NIES-54]
MEGSVGREQLGGEERGGRGVGGGMFNLSPFFPVPHPLSPHLPAPLHFFPISSRPPPLSTYLPSATVLLSRPPLITLSLTPHPLSTQSSSLPSSFLPSSAPSLISHSPSSHLASPRPLNPHSPIISPHTYPSPFISTPHLPSAHSLDSSPLHSPLILPFTSSLLSPTLTPFSPTNSPFPIPSCPA